LPNDCFEGTSIDACPDVAMIVQLNDRHAMPAEALTQASAHCHSLPPLNAAAATCTQITRQ
jgi:hypothetical protein